MCNTPHTLARQDVGMGKGNLSCSLQAVDLPAETRHFDIGPSTKKVCNGDRATGTGLSMQTIVTQNGEEVADGIKVIVLMKLVHGFKFPLEDIGCRLGGSTQTGLNMRKIGSQRDKTQGLWSPARRPRPI
jgi:hypothetical protein